MEKFNLKWNDFQPNISASFKKLRNHSEFHDVTLVSNDQKQVSAHKVVLSACSAFFSNILEKNKHPHPMLCLDGISSGQLDEILDYIYFGEVQIFHENINTFLNIAERLKLDGLQGTKEEDGQSTHRTLNDDTSFDFESTEDEIFPKESKNDTEVSLSHSSTNIRHVNEKLKVNAGDFSSVEELNIYIKGQILNTNVGKQCGICFYLPKNPTRLKDHVETHIEGLSFSCDNCDKSYSSRDSLRNHLRRCEKK